MKALALERCRHCGGTVNGPVFGRFECQSIQPPSQGLTSPNDPNKLIYFLSSVDVLFGGKGVRQMLGARALRAVAVPGRRRGERNKTFARCP